MVKDLALAYHNLSLMLDAGMPIFKSLETLANSSRGNLRNIFAEAAKAISEGKSLAEAMAEYPKVFAPLDVMLVEVADISGKLPESLMLLSRWYEFCKHLRNIITSGLMLPFVLIHIAAVLGPLSVFLLDRISLARYIVEVIGTLALFYLPLVIIFVILRFTPNVGNLRRVLDTLTLRIPLLGRAVCQLALSRFCRAFNMLYKAGVPITQSVQKAVGQTGNMVVSNLLKGGAESAADGDMVCEGFSEKLPPDFLNLWRIGEQTGELDNAVKHLTDTTAESAERFLTEFCKWLPRVIYWLVSTVIIIQIFRGFAAIGT